MPKNTKIKNILVIGSGPINIGQACEFDYSGTQALKALHEEGYRVILVNSNPATIMTDSELADVTYIEPITSDYITAVIEKERPDALIATLGGQTSLNCALELHKKGILAKYQVELIGASIDAITLAEDRTLFHRKMHEIGLDVPQSYTANTLESAIDIMEQIGLPLIVRSSFTLGGAGAALVHTKEEAIAIFKQAFTQPQEISIDEALIGWKEFELEVVRDKNDNCIVVCGVENFDPLGIHTGDSITVAPIQTLTDDEYQTMRDAAFTVLRAVGVDTGGSNVQFAVNPQNGRMVVIEMNPRVSRSSALVSKATGFPIAKIAAKLAVGYTLDELRNEITSGLLPASFEPSIDYTVVKIPRFHDEKFNAQELSRGPQMRSVGEVMAIGSTFAESLQNAILSLEINSFGFDPLETLDDTTLKLELKRHTPKHLWCLAESFRRGFTVEEVHAASFIDPWFLHQIKSLVCAEQNLVGKTLYDLDQSALLKLKKQGFSDQHIAKMTQTTEKAVRQYRQELAIHPVYKCVDSCAGEFKTETAYLYGTYQDYCESKVSDKEKIMIIGSGPNRIGQGIEFDYVCVKAIQAFVAAGFETIMVNCNPETVSTDYDVADKLYFIPLTYEKVLDLIDKEQPSAIALQFGGQTPLNLLEALHQVGVPLLGLTSDIVTITEDRDKFSALVHNLGLKQPKNRAIHSLAELESTLEDLQFPLIIRPSFVLGGRGMEVVNNKEMLQEKLDALFKTTAHAVLLEEFLAGAIEVDVDAVSDGDEVFIPAILEHIEAAGVHSGDSACITPPYRLSQAMINVIHQQTKELARALKIKGLMNVQYAVKGSDVFLIEVNPRASRTTPFICKVTGIPLVEVAVRCMLGHSLEAQQCLSPVNLPYYCVKEAVLPFRKFHTSSPVLSPEMKGTGEVMGIGSTPYEAYLKAQIAAGHDFSLGQSNSVLVSGLTADDELLTALKQAGFAVHEELEDSKIPDFVIAIDGSQANLSYALQHNLPYITTREAAVMLLRSLIHCKKTSPLIMPLQSLYKQVKHPSKTRHVLTGLELSSEEIMAILKLAKQLKQNPDHFNHMLAGKSLTMIFEKPSFRTRLSFTRAIQSLGGHAIESVNNTRKSEEPCDLIRVINGYCDFVMVRTHDDEILREMATYATVPIINGLSALYHPCQILADFLTLLEQFGHLQGLTLAYIGDGNNILHTLLELAPLLGITINYCCPPNHQPDSKVVAHSSEKHKLLINHYDTPQAAVHHAHAVYTDVWTSMGFEQQRAEEDFTGFQVNEALMAYAKPEAIFMHCMPMERGKEVSETLPDAPASAIFAQSENRLHVQKALLLFLQENK